VLKATPKGHVDKNLHVSQLTCFMLPLPAQCSKLPGHMDFSLTLYKTITETKDAF